MNWLPTTVLIIASYLLGSIPTGKIVSRLHHVDIFTVGSRSSGATNVSRALGFKWAALVGILDVSKSLLPSLMVALLRLDESVLLGVGCAACLGHVFSPFLGFRGGKAVSTYIGSLLVIIPVPTLIWIAAWTLLIRLINIMSLVNLIMLFVFVPILYVYRGPWFGLYGFIIWLFIIWTHRSNIQRLQDGKELAIR